MRGAWRIGVWAALVAALAALVSALASGGALASSPGSAANPYAVDSASLEQDGQQLVWNVRLDHGFTAPILEQQQRSLCLLVFPRARASGSLCVVARHGRIALRYTSPRTQKVIDAQISRSSPEQLTARFLPSAVGAAYSSLRWQLRSTQSGESVLFPARPAAASLHTPKLIGCVAKGPSLVYGGRSGSREIALTFDDGPSGQPPARAFTRLLARYHVPATFFEIGDQISTYDASGAAERAMLANGDLIGDHTWTHPVMTGLSPAKQRAQLVQTAHAIRRQTGFTPCLWRPPYGAVNSKLVSLARSLGMLTIMWDVDPQDWALTGSSTIAARVLSQARPGAIVIQHFGGGPRYETLAALPTEIRGLRAKGYKLVSLTQLLGLRLIYK